MRNRKFDIESSKPPHHQGIEEVEGESHILYKRPRLLFPLPNKPVNEYSFYISHFDEHPSNISRFMNQIRDIQPDDFVDVFINSNGGYVNEGKTIINGLESTGATLTTYLTANAYSMGSVMFCVGHRRVVYENSSLMYHHYSGGAFGKGGEMEDQIAHSQKNIKSFFKAYVLGLSDEEIQQMFDGKDFWFDCEELCQRGIATHVCLEGELIPADIYLKALKKTRKKVKKKHGVKIGTLLEGVKYEVNYISEFMEEEFLNKEKIKQEIMALSSALV